MPRFIGLVTFLAAFSLGCSTLRTSASGGDYDPHSSVSSLLERYAGTEDLRIWVDASYLLPYELYRLSLGDDAIKFELHLWFPYHEVRSNRLGIEVLRNRCVGPIRDSGKVLVCKAASQRELTGKAAILVSELESALRTRDLPVDFGPPAVNPDGTVPIFADGASVDVQLKPFVAATTAEFTQPGDSICRDSLCETLAELLRVLGTYR